VPAQPSSKPSAEAAGAFNSEAIERAELGRPRDELGVACAGRWDLGRPEMASELVDRDGDMLVAVRVNADRDERLWVWQGVHCTVLALLA